MTSLFAEHPRPWSAGQDWLVDANGDRVATFDGTSEAAWTEEVIQMVADLVNMHGQDLELKKIERNYTGPSLTMEELYACAVPALDALREGLQQPAPEWDLLKDDTPAQRRGRIVAWWTE